MNKFIGELEDSSGKLYESEYGQKFILSNDGSSVRFALSDTEEQRKYFEKYQAEVKEKIERYNSDKEKHEYVIDELQRITIIKQIFDI